MISHNSAEGINMGGLRSVYGVLGSWVLDDGDAVGQFAYLCILKYPDAHIKVQSG